MTADWNDLWSFPQPLTLHQVGEEQEEWHRMGRRRLRPQSGARSVLPPPLIKAHDVLGKSRWNLVLKVCEWECWTQSAARWHWEGKILRS